MTRYAYRVSSRSSAPEASSANLTTTEIAGPTIVLSTGNPLPTATVLGIGGRILPTAVIDDDSFAAFDPANDGIDFFETVEGTRVQVNNPVVSGPRNSFGELFVLPDNGAGAAAEPLAAASSSAIWVPSRPATTSRATSTPSEFSSTTRPASPRRTRTSATTSWSPRSVSSTTTSATSRSRSPRRSLASPTASPVRRRTLPARQLGGDVQRREPRRG